MLAELYPIADCPAGRLAIMPRPRAGDWLEDEILSWRNKVEVVVSSWKTARSPNLAWKKNCNASRLVCGSRLLFDRDVPGSATAVSRLVIELIHELNTGQGVGVHCRIGVGRASLLSVCLLTAMECSSRVCLASD